MQKNFTLQQVRLDEKNEKWQRVLTLKVDESTRSQRGFLNSKSNAVEMFVHGVVVLEVMEV
jgi:hypothetical protein